MYDIEQMVLFTREVDLCIYEVSYRFVHNVIMYINNVQPYK